MYAQAVKNEQEVFDFKELVDEFAQMHMHLASMQHAYDERKKQLALAANAQPSKTQLILKGYEYSVRFGETPVKQLVPKEYSNRDILELYGLGAFTPSVTAIRQIDADRNREHGFTPSILITEWGSRKLLSAYKS